MQKELTLEEYSYNDLTPKNFRNDKEFQNTIDEISQVTEDVSTDWKKREKCLKEIGGIILGNRGSNPAFVKFINQRLYLNLINQIGDLRSALMKEACRITIFICQRYGNLVEGAVEKMLTSFNLYKLIGSANKVISENTANCIYFMVFYVQTQKVAQRVCEQSTNKGTMIKLRCAQELYMIVKEYSESILGKLQQNVEEAIKVLLSDASSEVRSTARKIFFKYQEKFEAQAGILFNFLERSVQKQILEDKAKGDTVLLTNINLNKPNQTINLSNTTTISSPATESLSPKPNARVLSKSQKIPASANTAKPIVRQFKIKKEGNNTQKKPPAEEIDTNIDDQIDEYANYFHTPNNNADSNKGKNINYNYKSSLNPNKNVSKFKIQGNNYNKEIPKENETYETEDNPQEDPVDKNKKDILKNLNSKLNQLNLLSQEKEKKEGSIKSVENEVAKVLKKINDSYSVDEKRIQFEYFYNNFNQIQSNFPYFKESIIENLINLHIENLTEDNPNLVIQILKNLVKFFYYLTNIFNVDDINTILRLIVTHYSSKNSAIESMCNQLIEIIRKKCDNEMLFKTMVEIIDEGNYEEEICYQILNNLLEKATQLLKDEKYFSFLFSILGKAQSKGMHYLKFVENLYKFNDELFIKLYNSIFDAKQRTSLLIATQKSGSFLYKYLQLQFLKSEANTSKTNTNTQSKISNTQSKISNTSNSNSLKAPVRKASNEDDDEIVNNFDDEEEEEEDNQVSNINTNSIPNEVDSAILGKSIQNFIQYMSNYPNYIPKYIQIMTNPKYTNHSNTVVTFLYALLTKPAFQAILDAEIEKILNQVVTVYLANKKNQIMNENVKEILNAIPLKLNPKKYLVTISKYLTLNNDTGLVQIILVALKNFVMRQQANNLSQMVPLFIDSVFAMLNHQSSEIRKHAVYCAVEIYLILGINFEPYLNELNGSQQNLIKLFIKKKTGY
ncbi:MAG: hypothetical protein MJ252_09130 [archaeon]|nr:hypothetical protein [archaeon]